MRRINIVVACGLLAALWGCATPEGMSIPIGEARNYAPTDPEKIVILLRPPERKHEIVALVEGFASSESYTSIALTQAAAVGAMRQEAARLGAHAIVLTARGAPPYGYGKEAEDEDDAAIAKALGKNALVFGAAYYTITSLAMGAEKIQVGGTALRILD